MYAPDGGLGPNPSVPSLSDDVYHDTLVVSSIAGALPDVWRDCMLPEQAKVRCFYLNAVRRTFWLDLLTLQFLMSIC
jgi:hypothetical protein